MDKILIEMYVPAINQSYDIFIPQGSQMFQVLELVKKAVAELSAGRFVPTEETTFCYRETGSIVNINMTVLELGISNGSKLMLI